MTIFQEYLSDPLLLDPSEVPIGQDVIPHTGDFHGHKVGPTSLGIYSTAFKQRPLVQYSSTYGHTVLHLVLLLYIYTLASWHCSQPYRIGPLQVVWDKTRRVVLATLSIYLPI